MDKEVLVEIFLPPGTCHCSTKAMRANMDRIAKDIEEKFGVRVEVYYYPVNAPRAFEIGVSKANSVAVNGKVVLQGYFLAKDVRREILKVI